MANERTALAWVRTGLAVVGAGVGLTSLVRVTDLPEVLYVVSVFLCLVGAAAAVTSVNGWRRREHAMRTGAPLPFPRPLPWLAGAVALAGLVTAGAVWASARG